jgi:hypothetical protein
MTRGASQLAAVALFAVLAAAPRPAAGQQAAPATQPPDEYLEACQPHVLARVDGDAEDLGVPAGTAEVALDPLPTRQRKGHRTEVAGGGRFRLGPAYDWVPMTWTCRFDEERGRVDRAAYRGDSRAAMAALPPAQRQALDRCRRAVTSTVSKQAADQRWKSTQLTVRPGAAAAFTEYEGRPQVQGQGDVNLRVGYGADVDMRYTCTFDPDVDGTIDATVELGWSLYTENGRLRENRYETLTCSSSNFEEQRCSTSRPIAGNVRVKHQYSKTPCEGRYRWETWAIYVRDGCRAEFEFEVR